MSAQSKRSQAKKGGEPGRKGGGGGINIYLSVASQHQVFFHLNVSILYVLEHITIQNVFGFFQTHTPGTPRGLPDQNPDP